MLKFFLLIILISCQNESVHPVRGEVVEAVYGLGIIESENVYHDKEFAAKARRQITLVDGVLT